MEYRHAHSCIYLCRLCLATIELIGCIKDCMAHKAKNTEYPALFQNSLLTPISLLIWSILFRYKAFLLRETIPFSIYYLFLLSLKEFKARQMLKNGWSPDFLTWRWEKVSSGERKATILRKCNIFSWVLSSCYVVL